MAWLASTVDALSRQCISSWRTMQVACLMHDRGLLWRFEAALPRSACLWKPTLQLEAFDASFSSAGRGVIPFRLNLDFGWELHE